MFSSLKKHFIPNEGNEHSPHILRDNYIHNIVVIIIFLEIISFLIPILTRLNMTGGMAAVLPAVLSDLTNEERENQDLAILTINPILNKAAEMKAQDMATKGYFAHTSPEGKTPWYWLEKAGYKYQYAGENLAINFSDSKDVTNAWMKSLSHKANIVKENYTEIGTGIASGIYKGKKTVFVAQVYANPLVLVSKQNKSPKMDIRKISKANIIKEESTNVLGSEIIANMGNIENIPIQKPAFWQKLYASPRNVTNIIFYIIFGIIIFALFLYIFIKIKNQRRDLIANGLIVLAIIGAIFVANYYFSYHNMIIIQSLDYSNEY